MTGAPTPRDLFSRSRGRDLRKNEWIAKITPTVLPPNPDAVHLNRATDDLRRGRLHPNERAVRRPAAGYGSEAVSLYVGYTLMAMHEGDMLGYTDTRPRATIRGPLADRPRVDVTQDPRQPGAGDATPRCANVDPTIFDQQAYTPAQIRVLKRLCGGCPVKDACLQYALDEKLDGWWGGYDRPTRNKMR